MENLFDDIKKSYREKGREYLNVDKNKLAYIYSEFKEANDFRADDVMCAIIYKFWTVFKGNINKQTANVLTESQCYDAYIDGILDVLRTEPWKNENSTLYQVSNALERAISQKNKQHLYNALKASTADKRYINWWTYSLENFIEQDFGDIPSMETEGTTCGVVDSIMYKNDLCDNLIERIESEVDIVNLIMNYYKKKQYEVAYAIYAICYDDAYCFRVLEQCFREPNFYDFANRCNVSISDVKHAFHYWESDNYDKLKWRLKKVCKVLKKDEDIRRMREEWNVI